MAAITITFGEAVENHIGMQQIGARRGRGLTHEELLEAKSRFEANGIVCELVDLVAAAFGADTPQPTPEPAYVLVVREGVEALTDTGAMLREQQALPADRKFYNRRTGAVNNKIARHNLCFAEDGQEPDYEAGRGRVVAFRDVPHTGAVRAGLPDYFGEAARDLYAEGNYYYDAQTCGIGMHGDGERRVVIGCRLGVGIPLHFQWYYRNEARGERVALALGHGDLYAMSDKAVGNDWRRSVVYTLRHAAGAKKYLS